MSFVVPLLILTLLINLPFGYLRSRSKKYSVKWFVYIHFPVLLVIAARISSHTDYRFIPLLILTAVAGQLLGGKIRVT